MMVVPQERGTDLGAMGITLVKPDGVPSGCQSDAVPILMYVCDVGVSTLHAISLPYFQKLSL
jgi:hypothetical protein